ncbi:Ent-kaurene synthase [Lindgomyces ingoldianus]|uniref:Ent-kaurene synthase n=1 Tax=Lindgomyces ingoldianus TaxID=673940 RepID=A0ACB6RHC4_9PLEO|nr:Ent-kaurene synthase [Lindgomyces ingoldianus]KAF2478178.1 Ent-kaurene synthase [Lindgomyces ingoldianus]
MTANAIEREARELVHHLAIGLQDPLGLSSFSPSIYDTAWLSMVSKEGDSLFPQCFQYLLDTQQNDGSWESYSCPLDGIMNTMAGLLALQTKAKSLLIPDSNLISRSSRAETALRDMLQAWDISSCDRVGFEIIIPALLLLLESQGVKMDFPERNRLLSMCECKLSKLKPKLLGNTQSTLLHSLEGFAGILDYSTVKHQKSNYGAMLGSPSSTAAYLMYAPEWDPQAEEYLQKVVEQCAVAGVSRGVPSAFPTSIFEITWTIVSLLESGYTREDLGEESLTKLGDELESTFTKENFLVGFAPDCLPDADDTAMTISALGLLGRPTSVDQMLSEFEGPTWFRTYSGERNHSFSANCNVSLCLLRRADSFEHTREIVKCTQFLADSWYTNKTKDKWNVSEHYSMMLLAKSFALFLSRWGSDQLEDGKIPFLLIHQQIPVVILDILLRTLDRQEEDGSWAHEHEVTAYAILTLRALLQLSWIQSHQPEILSRISKGQEYLHQKRSNWTKGSYLWIEKVAYSSSNLSFAYCLSATKISPTSSPTDTPSLKISSLISIPQKKLSAFQSFFSCLPPFSSLPSYKISLWLLQASLFVPALSKHRFDIFARKNVSEDKYLQYIPFTWIAISGGGSRLGLQIQWEMMRFSLLMYQIDEFMEAVVGGEMHRDLDWVRGVVREVCRSGIWEGTTGKKRGFEEEHEGDMEGVDTHEKSNVDHTKSKARKDVRSTLTNFTSHILTHPRVASSPTWLRSWLIQELEIFLLSHITHISQSQEFFSAFQTAPSETATSPSIPPLLPQPYHTWIHTTGSNTTSCPFSFTFYLCLLPFPGTLFLASGLPRYLVQSMCRHLAIMCRQHNDIGSVARDWLEGNLNSVDFGEFTSLDVGGANLDAVRKAELLKVADYERRCLEQGMQELGKVVDGDVMQALRVFVEVTDLYGQIYLARDIGVKVQAAKTMTK